MSHGILQAALNHQNLELEYQLPREGDASPDTDRISLPPAMPSQPETAFAEESEYLLSAI